MEDLYRKTKPLFFLLSEDLAARFKSQCTRMGIPMSAALRHLMLGWVKKQERFSRVADLSTGIAAPGRGCAPKSLKESEK